MKEALRLGLRKTSTVDYPGRLAAILFFPGCNLRCPWCHNPELVDPELIASGERERHPLPDILSFLEKRRNLLGAVVLSGGEPTLSPRLGEIAAIVRGMGYGLKLDTNGLMPQVFRTLLGDRASRPDYIALDLKLPPRRYGELGFAAGTAGAAALEESCRLLSDSGIPHEFRTLVLPTGMPTGEELAEMSCWVDNAPWYFSPLRGGNCLDPRWNSYRGPEDAQVLWAVEQARRLGKAGKVRGRHPS